MRQLQESPVVCWISRLRASDQIPATTTAAMKIQNPRAPRLCKTSIFHLQFQGLYTKRCEIVVFRCTPDKLLNTRTICRIRHMSESTDNHIPILLWPFYAIWRLLTFILSVVGRLICSVLGIGMMIVGVLITMSVVGAPIGIPLASLGFLLLIRALF